MNKLRRSLTVFLILFSFSLQAQDTLAYKYFLRGLDYYNKGKLDTALLIWEDIVERNIGYGTSVYGSAFYNIPSIYWTQKNLPKAKEWFVKLIQSSDMLDGEESGDPRTQFLNYKHNSAINLADIYRSEDLRIEELHWLHMADTVVRFWGPRNDSAAVLMKHSYLLARRIEIYKALQMENTMMREIISTLIISGENEGYYQFPEFELFKMIPDTQAFKQEFDKALKGLKLIEKNPYSYSAIFVFKGVSYDIPIRRNPPARFPNYFNMILIGDTFQPNKKFIYNRIINRTFYKKLKKT